ncbi:hypothetical protein L5515_015662 [Caenorhabditis briggsae]|nr:hypothetical protein L5515_015662 [Caenorhabditis briggsae]
MMGLIAKHHRLKDWDGLPEQYQAWYVKTKALIISEHVVHQSFIENPRWQEHVKLLYDMQHDDMVAEICGTPIKLNKYQFDKYLHNQRQNFMLAVVPIIPYKIEILKDKRVFNIMIGFETTAREGYSVQNYWNVTYELMDFMGYHKELADFKITHISINGGCTEYGHVDLSGIPNMKNNTLELLKRENNPSVESLFELFMPVYATYLESSTREVIPTVWLESLDDDPMYLQATVCHVEKEPRQQNYTKKEFIRWYEKFQEMWHVKEGGAEDWIRVQMIDAKDDMLSARMTMSVQVGTNETAPVHDWDFRIVLRYNEHGDEKWYITKLDVLCPPTIDNYRDLSLMHIGDVVTSNFLWYVQILPTPVTWYQTLDFLKPFTHQNTMLAEICNHTNINLTEIYSKVISREYKNMESPKGEDIPRDDTYILYSLDNVRFDPSAKELADFKLATVLTGRANAPREWIYVWDFKIRWDDMDQFYYVEKVELACPEKLYGPAVFRFHKIQPIRFHY